MTNAMRIFHCRPERPRRKSGLQVAAACLSACVLLGTACSPGTRTSASGQAGEYRHGSRRFSQGWQPEWNNVQRAAQSGELAALKRALAELKALALLLPRLAADSDLTRHEWEQFAHRSRVVALLCDKVRLHSAELAKTDLMALEAAYVQAEQAWQETLAAMQADPADREQVQARTRRLGTWLGDAGP